MYKYLKNLYKKYAFIRFLYTVLLLLYHTVKKFDLMIFINFLNLKNNILNYSGKIIVFPSKTMYKLDKSAKLILQNGSLTLGTQKISYNDLQSRLIMEKHSKIVVSGSYSFSCGADVLLKENATLVLGNSSSNYNCQIRCGNKIQIGDNCTFGRNVKLLDSDFHEIRECRIK